MARKKIAPGMTLVERRHEPPVAEEPEADLHQPLSRTELLAKADEIAAAAKKPRGSGADDPVKDYNPFAPQKGVVRPDMPKVNRDMERVITTIFAVDFGKEHDRLIKEMRIGEKRTDRGTVSKAADDAEENARIAFDMYCAAYAEQKGWEAEVELIEAPMRSEAVAELENDKKNGLRSKQITDADVTAKMAAIHPDEFRHIARRRVEMKLLVERSERIADLWMSRCSKTRSFLDKVR